LTSPKNPDANYFIASGFNIDLQDWLALENTAHLIL